MEEHEQERRRQQQQQQQQQQQHYEEENRQNGSLGDSASGTTRQQQPSRNRPRQQQQQNDDDDLLVSFSSPSEFTKTDSTTPYMDSTDYANTVPGGNGRNTNRGVPQQPQQPRSSTSSKNDFRQYSRTPKERKTAGGSDGDRWWKLFITSNNNFGASTGSTILLGILAILYFQRKGLSGSFNNSNNNNIFSRYNHRRQYSQQHHYSSLLDWILQILDYLRAYFHMLIEILRTMKCALMDINFGYYYFNNDDYAFVSSHHNATNNNRMMQQQQQLNLNHFAIPPNVPQLSSSFMTSSIHSINDNNSLANASTDSFGGNCSVGSGSGGLSMLKRGLPELEVDPNLVLVQKQQSRMVASSDPFSLAQVGSNANNHSSRSSIIDPIEPAFLNDDDYPPGWLVYHPILGVVAKTEADKYDNHLLQQLKERQQQQQQQLQQQQKRKEEEVHQSLTNGGDEKKRDKQPQQLYATNNTTRNQQQQKPQKQKHTTSVLQSSTSYASQSAQSQHQKHQQTQKQKQQPQQYQKQQQQQQQQQRHNRHQAPSPPTTQTQKAHHSSPAIIPAHA